MNDEEKLTLYLGAFRYYLGRATYAVGDFVDILVRQWPTLPDRVRKLVAKEVDDAFDADDEARRDGRDHKPLGMDCDRRQWQRVREMKA